MALEEKSNNGGTTYLQLDYGKKSMYIYSPDEKDGYEKHTSNSGKVTYRKYVNAVTGKVTGAYFRDNNFGGTNFNLVFEDGDEKYSVQMSIDDSVFSNLARSIKNIDVSKDLRFSVYESKSKTSDKTYFGTSLSYPNELDSEGKAKLVEWGEELPKGKQLRNGKWDFSESQDEAYGRAEDFIKLNGFDENFKKDQTDSTKEQEVKNNQEEDDVESDLPF